MPRVLLTPRWIAGHLLALALVVLFVNLGFWQLRRLDQRRDYVAQVQERSALEPISLADALEGELLEYRTVEATGTFDPNEEVLLRGRSLGGQPGYNVLTPLVLPTGDAVLVERGWVSFDMDSVPVQAAPPPAGTVTVTGRLRTPDSPTPGTFGPRDPPEGELTQSYYVDVGRLQPQMPYELVPAYIVLTSVEPPHPGEMPLPLPPPDLGEGPHLGYAIQWFSFAAIGVIGYVFLMRHVVRGAAERAEDPREQGRG